MRHVFYTRIPRSMKDGDIKLRPVRIIDGPFLSNGLRDKDMLAANGLSCPISLSWFSVWWWLKKNFVLSYCIENNSKRIGFIGLYNLLLGNSAEMTLIIFEKDNRRLGLGTRAFNVFAQNLRRYSIARKIKVRVKTDNGIALSFWEKIGFEEICTQDDVKIMCADLNHDCPSNLGKRIEGPYYNKN